MINNFEKISNLLHFDSEDDFYFCQILRRKKDNPDNTSNSVVVQTYFIKSVDELMEKRHEMILLADLYNARVGINLNRRSFEKIAFHNLRKVTDQIMNKDYRSVRKCYNSVCGANSNEKEKKWIIDVDVEPGINQRNLMIEIMGGLRNIEPIGGKIIDTIPTKNGFHLITKPFNVQQAREWLKHDIHKDNPTILYIP